MDDAVPMIRRRIHGIELHGLILSCIYQVMSSAGRDQYRESVLDRMFDSIEDCFADSGFDAQELIERMHFFPYVFSGLQVHHYQLAMLGGVQNLSKIIIGERDFFNIGDIASHIIKTYNVSMCCI